MYERVSPNHPDKIADRIAGAIVDLAYSKKKDPKVAAEVLIGHGHCHIVNETDTHLKKSEVKAIVRRITNQKRIKVDYLEKKQDKALAENQSDGLRCGDNGIFKGMPTTMEQHVLTGVAKELYGHYHSDGKYILNGKRLIICQSNANNADLHALYPKAYINPLGEWTGGTDVDSGATNRKLGSDMGDAVTGGGLHGKDLSKADVSVNIYAHLKARKEGEPFECFCAIGDDTVDGLPYEEVVNIARQYISEVGGFEKFAEWGLIQ